MDSRLSEKEQEALLKLVGEDFARESAVVEQCIELIAEGSEDLVSIMFKVDLLAGRVIYRLFDGLAQAEALALHDKHLKEYMALMVKPDNRMSEHGGVQ